MNVVIRERKLEDCRKIQEIITKSWQDTYRGIINDNYLDELSNNEESRIKSFMKDFDFDDNPYLVLEVDGEVVGFVRYSEADDDRYSSYGEITALYILDDYKGYGYGKSLFLSAVEKLVDNDFDKMIIGCLDGNKSNYFYQHMHGILDSTRIFSRGGEELIENVYVFENIKGLLVDSGKISVRNLRK